MSLGEYNGFSEEERMNGDKIIKKAIEDGILPDLHTIPCELCGQEKGIREYHAEDYSPDKILDDVICVCKSCHGHIHATSKGPGWQKREEEIKQGIKSKPSYNKKYWTKDDDLPLKNKYINKLKIVCWNCRAGFYTKEKYKKIRELDADIYVICEFNEPSKTDEDYEKFIKHHYYLEFPAKRNARGIAVIAKEGISLKDNNWYLEESNDFLSVRVEDKLDIVAVWTHGEKDEDYLNHVINYLERYRDNFKNSDNLVMCGDFNLDLGINNLDNKNKFVEILKEYGYESIYHYLNKVNFGEESQKTFFTKKKGIITEYFDDYLFANPKLVNSFELGSKDKYIGPAGTDTSDHVPLIFEVDL